MIILNLLFYIAGCSLAAMTDLLVLLLTSSLRRLAPVVASKGLRLTHLDGLLSPKCTMLASL